MPSNDFMVHLHAEVQGESECATSVLLSLIQSKGALLLLLGWGKRFLVHIQTEPADLQAGDLSGWLCWEVVYYNGYGKFGVSSCGQG